MLGELTVSSPSRTYVAICVNTNDGRSFRRFALPNEVANDAQTASWFFLNRIDSAACIEGVVTTEGFENAPEISKESSSMPGLVENFGINVRDAIARLFRPTEKKRRNLCAPIPLSSRKRPRIKTPLVRRIGR
jgi:hypothetical protein